MEAPHSRFLGSGPAFLYIFRNALALHGAKFGCGPGQGGARTVLVNSKAARSCITPVKQLTGRSTGRNSRPNGAGGASSAPVAAALANAIFDATDIRLRSVPFTTERVKAAFAKA